MEIFYLVLLIVVVSLGPGLLPQVFVNRVSSQGLADLTGFASGLLLVSAFVVVVPEGFHTAAESGGGFAFDPVVLGLAGLAGFSLLLVLEGWGIGHAVHEEHHDHPHGHPHVHHGPTGWMLVTGLSIHAATDGLAIGSAAAGGGVVVTTTVFLAVLIHKAPAAFSLGVFSMHERQNRNESVRDVVIFALSTPVMIMIAFYALADLGRQTIGLALLFSAGTFLYVATVDTLPDIHNPETGREALRNVLIGVGILTLILVGADYMGLQEHAH